ncbi:MAG: SocA family protein [Methanobrevibacter sp.]|nr:SocA family protein [Candidatus Methanoflexus mossambicus]
MVGLKKEKMKQMLHYIIHKCQNKSNFGRTVLYKLMYFSDFNNYEIYEELITNEDYVKRHRGPIPVNFDSYSHELEDEGKIFKKDNPIHTPTEILNQIHYYSNSTPETNLLNNNELNVIDSVIDKLSNMTAREISEYSHGDKPWRVAETIKN